MVNEINKATAKAHAIDEVTKNTVSKIEKSNRRAVSWFIVSWTILLALGIAGIYRQNQIATANKQHIDCVVKLFTVPLPLGARARTISNPSTTCNINFTP